MGAETRGLVLNVENEILNDKIAEALGWDRRKRREQILLMIACFALGAALLLMPFHRLLGADELRWYMPLALFALLAPSAIYTRRWRQDDPNRTLTGLDRELRLEERAVTAWDLLARNDRGAAAQLVFRQAEAGLRGAEPRTLFPRRGSWPV